MLLALIGDQWLTVTDVNGRRRLDDPDDFVRLEIQAALTRNVRIIPILVDGARMPRAEELPAGLAGLARRQALELSPTVSSTTPIDYSKYSTRPSLKCGRHMTMPRYLSQPVASASPAKHCAKLIGALAGPTRARSPSEPLDQSGPTAKNVSPFHRSRSLRLLLMIGGGILAAVAAVYLIIQIVPNEPTSKENNGAQSLASNEFKEEGTVAARCS